MPIRKHVRTCVILALITLDISVLAIGCAPLQHRIVASATYTSALVQVDRPQENRDRYGEVVTVKPAEGSKYLYEDQLLSAVFYVTQNRINFQFQNKTDHSLKIIWDETAFIDQTGKSGRVAHQGVKYVDRNASQPPSVVPAHGTLEDFVLPTDRVYYREGYYGQYFSNPGGWEELGLLQPSSGLLASNDTTSLAEFRSLASSNKGKRFGLLMPIEIEGVANEYTFWFEIQNVSVTTNR